MTRPDAYDVIVLAGIILLFVGLWLLAPWVALTVTGFILLIIGLYGAMRS